MLLPSGDPDKVKVFQRVSGLAKEFGFDKESIMQVGLEYRDVVGT